MRNIVRSWRFVDLCEYFFGMCRYRFSQINKWNSCVLSSFLIKCFFIWTGQVIFEFELCVYRFSNKSNHVFQWNYLAKVFSIYWFHLVQCFVVISVSAMICGSIPSTDNKMLRLVTELTESSVDSNMLSWRHSVSLTDFRKLCPIFRIEEQNYRTFILLSLIFEAVTYLSDKFICCLSYDKCDAFILISIISLFWQ